MRLGVLSVHVASNLHFSITFCRLLCMCPTYAMDGGVDTWFKMPPKNYRFHSMYMYILCFETSVYVPRFLGICAFYRKRSPQKAQGICAFYGLKGCAAQGFLYRQ